MQFFVLASHVTIQSIASTCAVHPVTNWISLISVLLIFGVGINYYREIKFAKMELQRNGVVDPAVACHEKIN